MPVNGEYNAATQDSSGSNFEASVRLNGESSTPLACAAARIRSSSESCESGVATISRESHNPGTNDSDVYGIHRDAV